MSSGDSKLLESMRRSSKGWKRRDLDSLLRQYGFVIENRAKHDKTYHPKHPELLTFLPRHNDIHSYVVKQVIRLIDRLLEKTEAGK